MLGINESVEKKINIDSSKDFNLSQWHGIQAYKGWMRNINLVFNWIGSESSPDGLLKTSVKLNLGLSPDEFADLAFKIQELSGELTDKKHKDYDPDFARAKKTLEDKKKEEEAEAIKEKVAEFKKDLDK
tara:strand:+ start:283 stop:669 length:387 start_codon:yes stop_codon:yes gene_type:complete